MNLARLDAIRKGLKVERLHTVPHIQPYSNGFHSAAAAIIAMELCELNCGEHDVSSGNVGPYMLLHDVSEYRTGDVPADVKVDHPSLREGLHIAEAEWCVMHDITLPELNSAESDICRIADLAELGMYCVDELRMGNRNVSHVLENVIQYLEGYLPYKGVRDFKGLFTVEARHGS